MRDVRIEPKEHGKGRTFQAACLATVEADGLWDGGLANDSRPVWAMFAGSEQELRPFMANVSLGRKMEVGDKRSHRSKGDRLEFLKSAGYQIAWQRETEGAIATIFLADLFRLDPGMIDPEGAKFVLLPTRAWAEGQTIDSSRIVKHALKLEGHGLGEEELLQLIPIAFLFCAYLDRRTRCPLVSDGRFYLQTFLASLRLKLATWSTGEHRHHLHDQFGRNTSFCFRETGTEDVGLLPGVAFYARHHSIEEMLAEEVKLYFSMTRGR